MDTDQQTFNCPNCGGPLSAKMRSTKMVDCPHCETTVLLRDDGFESMGTRGIMADHPSLIRLGETFRYDGVDYHPVGQARFSYGRGWWDEFWTIMPEGGYWISVDEGDIAVEQPTSLGDSIPADALSPGAEIRLDQERWIVSEEGEAVCEAVRGELPEPLRPGTRYKYWHLSGPRARLITVEIENGEVTAHEGHWLDPFAIEAAS